MRRSLAGRFSVEIVTLAAVLQASDELDALVLAAA